MLGDDIVTVNSLICKCDLTEVQIDAWLRIKTALAVAQNTPTNTAGFQLPLTMESCIEHLRATWGDIHITAEVRCAVEETHDFIERQLQTLL